MRITRIIESKRWRNTVTNATASIYGAVPYTSETDKPNWIVEIRGYTWETDQGTIGLCRAPAKTMAEAIEVMESFNAKFNQDDRTLDELVFNK